MKIPKEYLFLSIGGLFLLAYVLEAVVDPLSLKLPSPYHYLAPENLISFPFTTAIIAIRALAIFLIPLFFFSFFSGGFTAKALISLLVSGLMQLYSLQEVATGTTLAPLEWSLSLSVAGMATLIPVIYYFVLTMAQGFKDKIDSLNDRQSEATDDTQ